MEKIFSHLQKKTHLFKKYFLQEYLAQSVSEEATRANSFSIFEIEQTLSSQQKPSLSQGLKQD